MMNTPVENREKFTADFSPNEKKGACANPAVLIIINNSMGSIFFIYTYYFSFASSFDNARPHQFLAVVPCGKLAGGNAALPVVENDIHSFGLPV